MRLNGLTNNLQGNDQSLSNSYLSHIVELLRQEVAALSSAEEALNTKVDEHIEEVAEKVETETVIADSAKIKEIEADSVKAPTLKANNSEIHLLENAITMLGKLSVNGYDVVTEESYTGPFAYKGVVTELPQNPSNGDVYILDNEVNIYGNGEWYSYDIPYGTVTQTQYDDDMNTINGAIGDLQQSVTDTNNDLSDLSDSVDERFSDVNDEFDIVNATLEDKLDKNPEDGKSYVRKDGEWVEQSVAANTVKAHIGNSYIESDETHIEVGTDRMDIYGDVYVNEHKLPEINKLGLTRTSNPGEEWYYKLKFGRSPVTNDSSIVNMYTSFVDSYLDASKSPGAKYTVFTKNYQYVKWCDTYSTTGNASSYFAITAMDKNGKISLIDNAWSDWISASHLALEMSSFISFNPEYCPEGYEDTVYLFNPGYSTTLANNTSTPYLIEMDKGELVRKVDLWNGNNGLKAQGWPKPADIVSSAGYSTVSGGKSLRNKDIQRILITGFNVGDVGCNWAIIIGGDVNSQPTDPFDPSKSIYISLPATAYWGYNNLMSTDQAWYLTENATGKFMRITPNGQVTEYSMVSNYTTKTSQLNYIEYTDKNNKPAVAFYSHVDASGGWHGVTFIEEGEDGQVTVSHRGLHQTADTWYQGGAVWPDANFKFMENSNYIFFTQDYGFSPSGNADFGTTAVKGYVWYFDKKTLTNRVITNMYSNWVSDPHSFIEMHKTKGGAIWFVPLMFGGPTKANRTGELHYISDEDYTEIDPETGKDVGEIVVQSVNVGTAHSFFTSATTQTLSNVCETHPTGYSSGIVWSNAYPRTQMSATNDDGILCIMATDFMAYALCYGDGNIKVYECSNHDGVAATATTEGGLYDCDPDKIAIIPDKFYYGYNWYGQPNLVGTKHGWLFSVASISDTTVVAGQAALQYRSYTYIGAQYVGGEATILKEPHLTKLLKANADYCPQRKKFETYAYLQTYDDYERRKLVMRDCFSSMGYSVKNLGIDGYFIEERKEDKKLNLVYDNTVISSVDDN